MASNEDAEALAAACGHCEAQSPIRSAGARPLGECQRLARVQAVDCECGRTVSRR